MATRPTLRPGTKNRSVITAKKLAIAHLKKFKKHDMANAINPKHATYGPSAVKGIRYIQRRYKLDVDGIIGPDTWKVLRYIRKPKLPALSITPREGWSARTPRGITRVFWPSRVATRVHHTATTPPVGRGRALRAAEKKAMQDIQKYHMDTRKYSDIAYNFIIMPSGRVYEGRGRGVMGAHTLSHNGDCGIAFVGNYNNQKLTWRQVIAYKLLRHRLRIAGGGAFPHKATYNTSCPGTNTIERLGL